MNNNSRYTKRIKKYKRRKYVKRLLFSSMNYIMGIMSPVIIFFAAMILYTKLMIKDIISVEFVYTSSVVLFFVFLIISILLVIIDFVLNLDDKYKK